MVKINKVYTKTGDDGSTGLVGGKRISKTSLRVTSFGEIDELNSFIGWARTISEKEKNIEFAEKLAIIQNDLFDIGSELATPHGETWSGKVDFPLSKVTQLESWIDLATKDLPELKSFVLPGGTELNSALHISRSVCRRAERKVLELNEVESVSESIRIYINRLSDLLFVMARSSSFKSGITEYLWKHK